MQLQDFCYLIDRENLEGFIPEKREYVATIMNAWYIHDKFNFNISPYIYPFYISVFFKNYRYDDGITVGYDYINENVRKSMIKYGPVGCRDKYTKKVMDELKVKSYFSGCMTLTLEKFKNVKKQDYIVTVGLNEEEYNYIKSKTKRKIIKFKQDVPFGSFSNESWEQRKNRVEETLKLYQAAHMVITTKLHCSLPCLAIGTPVLLLYDTSFKENEDRIGTYINYLNYVDRNEFSSCNIDFENPKANPKKHMKIRQNLIDSCTKFIKENNNVDNKKLPDINLYKEFLTQSKITRDVVIKHLNLLSKKYVEECKKASIMHDKYEKLQEEYQILKKEHEQVVNSKVWRFAEKVRNAKK